MTKKTLNKWMLALGMVASIPAQAATYTGSLDAGNPVVTGERILRDGIPSACGASKAFPGVFVGGTGARYDEALLTNTGAAGCVNVQIDTTCDAPGVHLTAYGSAFNPTDVSQNYLGDSGSSALPGAPQSLNIEMAAGQTIRLVASNNTGGTPSGACSYTLTSTLPMAAASRAVPAVGPWGLAAMSLLAAGLASRRLRRRARSALAR